MLISSKSDEDASFEQRIVGDSKDLALLEAPTQESIDFVTGYTAAEKGEPFQEQESINWKRGWDTYALKVKSKH